MEYNGGSVVAMIGKDCVAIATDLRLGQQSIGVAYNFDKVGRRVAYEGGNVSSPLSRSLQ